MKKPNKKLINFWVEYEKLCEKFGYEIIPALNKHGAYYWVEIRAVKIKKIK